MNQRPSKMFPFVLLAMAALVGVGAILTWSLTPRPQRYQIVEGRPLLGEEGKEFVDEEVGLRFTPPGGWAMQARSTVAPTYLADRRIVKYKRFSPSYPAWLRVRVKDITDETTPAQMLSNWKPPEQDWKPLDEVEKDLRIGDTPAARRLFGGPFDHDGRGNKEFHCEIVVVKRNGRIFEFSGTYLADDTQSQQDLRQTMKSVVFFSE